jgi:hypothetical protein
LQPGSVLVGSRALYKRPHLAHVQFENAFLKDRSDLHSAGIIRQGETAFKIAVWTFNAEIRFVVLPWPWAFSGDEESVSLHGHSYVLRFHFRQIDPEQVLLGIFQDVHRWKPIGLSVALLTRRNRRQWRQQRMMISGYCCIHCRRMRNQVSLFPQRTRSLSCAERAGSLRFVGFEGFVVKVKLGGPLLVAHRIPLVVCDEPLLRSPLNHRLSACPGSTPERTPQQGGLCYFEFSFEGCRPNWISFSRILSRVTPSQRAALAWLPRARRMAWENNSGSRSVIIFA